MLHQKVVLVVVVDQVNKNKVKIIISFKIKSLEIFLFLEKSKSMSNEQLIARKSQDVSNIIETEKLTTKKSIYLKVAEFLLKYNVATV